MFDIIAVVYAYYTMTGTSQFYYNTVYVAFNDTFLDTSLLHLEYTQSYIITSLSKTSLTGTLRNKK